MVGPWHWKHFASSTSLPGPSGKALGCAFAPRWANAGMETSAAATSTTAARRCGSSGLISLLQSSDVELLHLHEGPRHRLRLARLALQHPGQDLRRHLPREAVAVLEPAARAFLAAVG